MDDDSDLAFEILRSLRRILRKVSQHSRNLSREVGLTVPQLLCMRAIRDGGSNGRVTAATVSQRVRLSPPTVSRIVERLERAGLISRKRDHEDRRRVWISLTDNGRERLAESPTPLQEEFLARIGALPRGERQALLTSLEKIVEMMEAGELDAAPVLLSEEEVPPGPSGG
jgi:DNA-binding MarR family transcriptional regulator